MNYKGLLNALLANDSSFFFICNMICEQVLLYCHEISLIFCLFLAEVMGKYFDLKKMLAKSKAQAPKDSGLANFDKGDQQNPNKRVRIDITKEFENSAKTIIPIEGVYPT